MKEIWRPVIGHEERYIVSNLGRVKSLPRLITKKNRHGKVSQFNWSGKILSQSSWGFGVLYPGVNLSSYGSKKRTKDLVHRLVADAFIPNPKNLPEVNHLDANPLNPRANNLEWVSHGENTAYTYKIGNRPIGKMHHFSKLKRDVGGRCMPEEL